MWVGTTALTMRDSGLEQAIKAAGGVASLARAIGIAQPSVSNWARIPAERVLAVEALTKVSRFILRPDLYGSADDATLTAGASAIDEIDRQRAAEYGLLALLLGKAPNSDTLARIAQLKGDASDLGMAHIELGPLRRMPTSTRSTASSSISSSAWAAATCCPTPRIT